MNILALDTAAEILSVALAAENEVWYAEIDAGTRHSELLMECVDGLCKSAGLSPEGIDLAGCMKGPGSFTGLRIGFSAAKGLATALGIPLVAAPTLDCLAYPFSVWPGLVIPAIDAKKDRFYAALYRGGALLTDYLDAPAEMLAKEAGRLALAPSEPLILTGPGAELLRGKMAELFPPGRVCLDPNFRGGRARELLKILKSGKFEGANDIDSGPVYLRKSDAELKL